MRGSERGACTIAMSLSRPIGVLAGQPHDEIQALVLDARKRPRRIEPERAQHRLDFGQEVMLDPGARVARPSRAASSTSMPGLQRAPAAARR